MCWAGSENLSGSCQGWDGQDTRGHNQSVTGRCEDIDAACHKWLGCGTFRVGCSAWLGVAIHHTVEVCKGCSGRHSICLPPPALIRTLPAHLPPEEVWMCVAVHKLK